MQTVIIALLLAVSAASAGLVGVAPAVVAAPTLVRTAPIVAAPVYTAPVVHAVPVAKTVVPVAHSSTYSVRAPAAKFVAAPVPVIAKAPVFAPAPVLIH